MTVSFLKKFWVFALALLVLFPASGLCAENGTSREEKVVYVFWNYGCPYCEKELEWVDSIAYKYPQVEFRKINVSENPDLFREMCERSGVNSSGWPRTFVGGKAFYGFLEIEDAPLEFNQVYGAYSGFSNQIEKAIQEEFDVEPVEGSGPEPKPKPVPIPPWAVFIILPAYLAFCPILRKRLSKRAFIAGGFVMAILATFGFVVLTPEYAVKQFASDLPFPAFVFIIALLDGFNPCAFTVLAILLSLLTYTKSKKKMAMVGTVFILTSGAMYFIFIMGILLAASHLFEMVGPDFLRLLGAGIIVVGAINIKDFFFFKKGLSLTLGGEKLKAVYSKARQVVENVSQAEGGKPLLFALLATVALAVFVNLVELGCTAMLPAAYVGSLVQTFGTEIGLPHVIYTAFYGLVYIVPLFAILFNFIYFFKSERVSKEQGRILKLLSGALLLALGLVMLVNPDMLIFAA